MPEGFHKIKESSFYILDEDIAMVDNALANIQTDYVERVFFDKETGKVKMVKAVVLCDFMFKEIFTLFEDETFTRGM